LGVSGPFFKKVLTRRRQIDNYQLSIVNGQLLTRRAPQEPCGEGDDGFKKVEDGADGDAHQAKRKGEKPEEGVKNEAQQRQRPAQEKKDKP